MTRESDRRAALRTLIEALCEGTITPEQMADLENSIRTDPEAEAFYIKSMHLQAGLWQFGRVSQQPVAGLQPRGPQDVAAESKETAGRRGPSVHPSAIRGGARRRRRVPWIAAAALVLVAVVTLGTLLFRFPRPWGSRRVAAPVAARPRARVDLANGLAVIVKLDGVEWDEQHPSEGDLLAAGHLRFRSGRATLSLLTGVSLVVQGPADVELVSSNKVLCHRGKLWARVPEEVEGFVVSGPGSAVVDLGTEFGMNVEQDGRTRGKVFEGLVEAALLSEAGSYQRTRMMDRGSDIFEINPRTGRIGSDKGPQDFVAPSKLAARPLVLDEGYRDAVLRSRPWSYWRFESLADGLTPNEVPGRPSLRAYGPVGLSDPAQGNKSAVFGAGQPGQYLTLDGTWEPARHPGFAVELWFLAETISHAMLVSMLADAPQVRPATEPADFHRKLLLELTSRTRRQLLHRPASVRFLHRFPPGWYQSSDNLYSDEYYIPYRWYHVVGQMNEDKMELFLDGQPTRSLSVDPAYTNGPCQLLLGRVTTIPRHHEDTSRPFVGRMDEVALYDHPLTIEEIRQHQRLGDLRARPK